MGTQEIIIIAVVILVLFGGSQLPKLARSVGQASTEFKKGVKQGADEEGAVDAEADKPAT